jgi:SAM-dependent methyltransferase
LCERLFQGEALATESKEGEVFPSSNQALRWRLFLLSFLALFCELLIIRWMSTEVRIFAYFKNLPLMSAFLGLGLGFLWSKSQRDYFCWSAFGLLCMSAILMFGVSLGITFLSFLDPAKYMVFGVKLLSQGESSALFSTLRSLAIMLGLFALSTSIFVGLGQRMGRLFAQLKPLEAYSINIAGSLLGSVFFSLLSYLGTSPGVWLLTAGVLFICIQRRPTHFALAALGIAYSLFLAHYIAEVSYGPDFIKTVWSPYYRLDVAGYRQPTGPLKGKLIADEIYVNYEGFQTILDCTSKTISSYPKEVRDSIFAYHAEAFRLRNRPESRVLILGSGSGADVAAALRWGVQHVDAVEIDPQIAKLGRTLHPEKPYSSPKVSLHVVDARTFLRNCKDKYDLIEFAYMDSHAAFSCLSSLRTDNYVFTQESIQEAAHLLKPDGFIAIGCVVMPAWLWDRHSKALSVATGMKPFGYAGNDGKFDVGLLFAGPGLAGKSASSLTMNWPPKPVNLESSIPVSTDDWPFLFLPERGIPMLYILPIIAVLLISAIPVSRHFAGGASDLLNWQMFWLGAGFMLLEVRAMADLSLLFGSTWVVNSVIISGVMIVVLLANLAASRMSVTRIPILGVCLIASLFVTNFVHASSLTEWGFITGALMGTGMYLLPMVFSSTIFALLFKCAQISTTAFAYNLIGGLLGVTLEYLSMWLGIGALGWIAVVIYSIVLSLYLANKSNIANIVPIAEQVESHASINKE